MLTKFINNIGSRTILFVISFYEAFIFTFLSLSQLLIPKYYNSQMRVSLVHYIFYTSIIIIPYFILSAFFFGSIVMGFIIMLATEYNMQMQIGSIIVIFIIKYFSTLFTVLFISFRLHKLIKNDTFENLIVPRIISSVISVLSLSILFSIITLSSAYLFTFFIMNMDIYTYKSLIYNAINIQDIVIMLLKSIVLGSIVILVPIYTLYQLKSDKNSIYTILLSIFFIEIFFYLGEKVIHAL